MKTRLPESAMATVEKIADALCAVDESPDLHHVVKLAKKIYNCDEEATGMIANLATTAIAETLVVKSRSNHNGLAVSDEWGWAKKAVEDVGKVVHDGVKCLAMTCDCDPSLCFLDIF